jgi:hypothetical protein
MVVTFSAASQEAAHGVLGGGIVARTASQATFVPRLLQRLAACFFRRFSALMWLASPGRCVAYPLRNV